MKDSKGSTLDYEYALVQFRPVVSSEERVNIGLALYAPATGQFAWRVSDHYGRLTSLFPDLQGGGYRRMVRHLIAAFQSVAGSAGTAANAQQLEPSKSLSDILNRILPPTVSNFGCSPLRWGFTADIAERADQLFDEYVLSLEEHKPRERVDDRTLWEAVRKRPSIQSLEPKLEGEVTLRTPRFEYTFPVAWHNGHRQVAQPISLDYIYPAQMVDEANKWTGRLVELRREHDFEMTAIVTDAPTEGASSKRKYDQAIEILTLADGVRKVIPQSQADALAELIKKDLHSLHRD